ncbi:MAG: GyrI-like domain-containing protein [Peptococcaceae bacterium]|nr:GyrI-like domain-containing protein [Peptococcaceae bacterium]
MFKIELLEQQAQPVLAVKTKTRMEDLPRIIGESYGKIMGYMSELGEQPADAPYTAYYNLDMENLDVEMGFPVSKAFPDKDGVKAAEIPGGKFACSIFKGPYSSMEGAYNQMFKWIEENGYQSTGVYYEYYYNAPSEVPESELLTRIVMPLK